MARGMTTEADKAAYRAREAEALRLLPPEIRKYVLKRGFGAQNALEEWEAIGKDTAALLAEMATWP